MQNGNVPYDRGYNKRPDYAHVPRVRERKLEPNIQEILKAQIYSDQNYNTYNPANFTDDPVTGLVNTYTGQHKDIGLTFNYLHFDTAAASAGTSLGDGAINFDVAKLNNGTNLENIIRLKLNKFYFPKIRAAGGANKPDATYYQVMYMQITTISNKQAYQGNNSAFVYHFALMIEEETDSAYLISPNPGVFEFSSPVTTLSEFNIKIFKPSIPVPIYNYTPLAIPSYELPVRSVAGGTSATFELLNGHNAEFQIDYIGTPTAPGIAIMFPPNLPTGLQAAFSSALGYYIVEVITATQFRVDGVAAFVSGGDMTTIYVNRNRFMFSIMATGFTSRQTNHIQAVTS